MSTYRMEDILYGGYDGNNVLVALIVLILIVVVYNQCHKKQSAQLIVLPNKLPASLVGNEPSTKQGFETYNQVFKRGSNTRFV